MSNDNFFIPNILLCGDRSEFFSEIGDIPVKIVGQVELFGKIGNEKFNFLEDNRFTLDNQLLNVAHMIQILTSGTVDFLVLQFLKGQNFKFYNAIVGKMIQNGCSKSQILTSLQFKMLPLGNFYDCNADAQLLAYLNQSPFKTLLDYDGHFAKSQILSTETNDSTEIDGIYNKDLFPLKKNIYRNIYLKSSDCKLRHYDAILIEERTPLDFDTTFFTINNPADAIITFSRYGSKLYEHVIANQNRFEKIITIKNSSGQWIILNKRRPPEDFIIYVVTHKILNSNYVANFPEGYRVIHAGRELSQDLGYIGDNTGDNVSYLNPYINEITALYWIWKNTAHTIIGFSHYRRFFTASVDDKFAPEKILTKTQATEILKDYDIILGSYHDAMLEFENICVECGEELAKIARQVIAQNIEKFQPEYLDAFEFVMNNPVFYRCNMFVTRRNVFDVYCSWLFSFFFDSVNEMLRLSPLHQMQGKPKRLMGYFAERMITTWIVKNNLRVKELGIMYLPNL